MTAPGREDGTDRTGARFPPAERLRTDREYRDVVRKGERAVTPHFTLYRDFMGQGRKFGVSAGKRVGKAADRNRIKRLLRELYRLHKGAFPGGTRTAVVVRKMPPDAGLAAVGAELLPAIERRWGKKGEGSPCTRKTYP